MPSTDYSKLSTPMLDAIQHAAAAITSIPPDIYEGETKEIKVMLHNVECGFVIWKEENRIKSKYEGDFRVIIQRNSIELIETIASLPEWLRFGCRDKHNNLLVHVICWRRLEKYVKYFLNESNSCERDCSGWIPLHYTCYSDNLEAVRETLINGDQHAVKVKDGLDNYPVDLTDNPAVVKLLNQIK